MIARLGGVRGLDYLKILGITLAMYGLIGAFVYFKLKQTEETDQGMVDFLSDLLGEEREASSV